jgi:hypothetical protein
MGVPRPSPTQHGNTQVENQMASKVTSDKMIDYASSDTNAPTPSGPSQSASAAQDLFILKFRRGMQGVQTGFVKASSMKAAERVGQTYCDSLVGARYITVLPAILADESILGSEGEGADIRQKLAAS